MKFVFSAFSVGLASSFAATVSITESIQERRDLLFAREKQADREKLEAKIYSYVSHLCLALICAECSFFASV